MSLLPSRDPAVGNGEPRVIQVDSEDADEMLAALSAATARRILGALHEEPSPPGELADRVDTSLQNAQYHLKKLEDAGAVEVVDTAYSEKGREMDIYAPANEPLVICAGDDQDASGLRQALTRLVGGLAVLAAASLLVQQFLGTSLTSLLGPAVHSGTAGGQVPDVSYYPNGGFDPGSVPGAAGQAAATAGHAAAGLPPGLLFFAGGAAVLLGVGLVRRYA
ncbi:MAG: ArsR/SmtB family transcription factor [Haloarculaceae archaeon]